MYLRFTRPAVKKTTMHIIAVFMHKYLLCTYFTRTPHTQKKGKSETKRLEKTYVVSPPKIAPK